MQRVGAYEVLYELSSGGMGSVLLGRRRGPGSFEKVVAIKTIRAELAAAPQVRAMFLDEAAILARLGHPAVAAVHDFGEEGKTLYLVMEYVAGVSLRAVADLEPPPPPHIVAAILAEACRGLHAAHELSDLQGHHLGIVHRDISPDNLLLGFDGHVKVIDFGIALIKNRQAPVTELGTLKGKPPYMSPEQIKNEPIDRRSDVFALGAVLWEMLVGEPLFSGDSIYAIARAVEHQEIARPSSLVAGVLPGLDSIALEALQRDVALRTPTAAAMAARLDEVVAAAEGETLAEWTKRCFAADREEHRLWLAQVLGGDSSSPRRGRATGEVTALAAGAVAAVAAHAAVSSSSSPVAAAAAAPLAAAAAAPLAAAAAAPAAAAPVAAASVAAASVAAAPADLARAATAIAQRSATASSSPSPSSAPLLAGGTSAGLALDDAAPPRAPRDRFFAIFVVLFLALVGLVTWIIVARTSKPAAPLASLDPVDAAAISPPDAAPVVVIPADAAPVVVIPADAAPVVVIVADAAPTAPTDAAPADSTDAASSSPSAPSDPPRRRVRPSPAAQPPPTTERDPDRVGAPVEAVQLPGKLSVFAEPYANVFVDGKPAGPTPVFGFSLPAGRHVVTFVDPVTGDTRARKNVDVPANGDVKVHAPPPKP